MPTKFESLALLNCTGCSDQIVEQILISGEWTYSCIKGHINDGNPKNSRYYGELKRNDRLSLPRKEEIIALRDPKENWKKTGVPK